MYETPAALWSALDTSSWIPKIITTFDVSVFSAVDISSTAEEIPVVVLPFGSIFARQNSISQSAATDWKPAGVFEASEFSLLKSLFKISI